MSTQNLIGSLEDALGKLGHVPMGVRKLIILRQISAGIRRSLTVKPLRVSEERAPYKHNVDGIFGAFEGRARNLGFSRSEYGGSLGTIVDGFVGAMGAC